MKKSAFLIGIVFVLFSCNSGNKESSNSTTKAKSEVAKSYDCLKEYQEDYSKLLSKEEMASVYPFSFDDAKVKLKAGKFGSHIYTWPSDRPVVEQEIQGRNIKSSDYNSMGVALLSFYSDDIEIESVLEEFNMAYKQLSEEEQKKIQDNLDKQSEDVRKSGMKMMEKRMKEKWDAVENVGTSAWYKWSDRWGGELAVLAGRAKFYIRLKISDNSSENLAIAEKLAIKVLDKCH